MMWGMRKFVWYLAEFIQESILQIWIVSVSKLMDALCALELLQDPQSRVK